MAFGDSTEKDVRIALSVTNADEVKTILDDIKETLRSLQMGRTDISLGVSDPTLTAKLDEIKTKLDDLGRGSTDIKLKATGFDETIAKLETIDRLKKSVSGDVNIRVRDSGTARAAAGLAADKAAADAAGGGGGFMRLAGLAGMGTSPISLAQGGIAGFITSPVGAGVVATLLPTIGALLTTALGVGVAGLGVVGAYKIGSSASAQQVADQAALRSAQLSLQRTTGSSISAQQTRAQDLQTIATQQRNLAAIKAQDGAFIQIYQDIQKAGSAVKQVFGAALSGGGKNSFVNQIAGDLKMVAPMIKDLQGPLTKLFQASAPYARAFLIIMDELAKTAIPAITAALKNFEPHLPGLERSFQIVFDAVSALIDGFAHLAGAMADAVSKGVQLWKNGYPTFKGIFEDIRGLIDWLISGFEQIVGAIQDVISWIGKVNNAIGGGIRGALGGVAHFFGLSGGGVLPGYAPGQDIIPAMLSPGESVLTPEATRAIGPANIMNLNAATGRPPGATGVSIMRAAGGFLGSVGGGGGLGTAASGGLTVVNINLSGVITNPDATARQIQQVLLNLKRHNGQRALGLT